MQFDVQQVLVLSLGGKITSCVKREKLVEDSLLSTRESLSA